MTEHGNLLDKYYNGKTSLEEEKVLKSFVLENEKHNPEKMFFEYFEQEANVPEGLENELFNGIERVASSRMKIRKFIFSFSSAAAIVFVLLSVFLNFRNTKRTRLEDNFFVMEQALFQVSESLQPPQEKEEMLVLWVDDDVEIIIN